MIKAFIFDFGGVLARTEDYTSRHAWDERLGLPVGSVERAVHHSDIWIQAQLGRITPRAYWNGVAELLYMRKEDVDELRHDYFSGDRLNYRLVTLIRDLREKGTRWRCSATSPCNWKAVCTNTGIYDLFDHVLISALMGMMKPDPTVYRVALQSVRAAPTKPCLSTIRWSMCGARSR